MSKSLLNILRRSRYFTILHKHSGYPIQVLPSFTLQKEFYLCSHLLQSEDVTTGDSAKKSKQPIKITLLSKNDSMTVTTLEEAQKLSRRRQLNLVKVQDLDNKTQRPVYKLVSQAELLAEEVLDGKKEKEIHRKGEKLLTIGNRIAEHDLKARLNHIEKWLSKGHEVRVLIQGVSTDDSAEKVFAKVQHFVKDIGRIVQKHVKNSNIKFSILPPSGKHHS